MSNGPGFGTVAMAMAAASLVGVGLAIAQNPPEQPSQPLPALHNYTVNTNGPATLLVKGSDEKPYDGPTYSPGGLVKVEQVKQISVIVQVDPGKYATCWIRDDTTLRIGDRQPFGPERDDSTALCSLTAGEPR